MGEKRNSKKDVSPEETIFSYIIKDYNSCGSLSSTENKIIAKDIKGSILYEASFKKCIWEKCDLTNVSGNGCKFFACDFWDSKIINAAFQHSIFEDNIFYNNDKFLGTNLAYSIFEWDIIKKTDIYGCAFTGAIFNNTTIQDCSIKHSNFELCVFQNTTLKNVDLSNLTLKYVFFKDVKMHDVNLPFMQMPYTFGGMKYVLNQADNVKISTTNAHKPFMSVKEYRKMLPKLIDFFYKQNDYFPLANCYIANNQMDDAKKANKAGILQSTSVCDFRKLYFFCLQATQEIRISKNERRDIYNQLSNSIRFENLSGAEYHEFRHYYPMIKRLMFDNPYNNPTLSFSIHTNIEADNYNNLSLLMKVLDKIADNSGEKLDSKHLEIRHNSPNIIDWFPIGELPALLNILKDTLNALKPFMTEWLSNLVQYAGTTATIIGTVYNIKTYNNSNVCRDNIELKDKADSYKLNSNAACVPDEIKAMRKELEIQKAEYQKNLSIKYKSNPNKTKKNDNDISDIIKKIEKSNIKINDIEIHLLGEQANPWEFVYNNGDII